VAMIVRSALSCAQHRCWYLTSRPLSTTSKCSPFHPRNKHKGRYDLPELVLTHPPLATHIIESKGRRNEIRKTVDFEDPEVF